MNAPASDQFRLTFQHEGEFTHAYFAHVGTMEGAHLLGTMRTATLRTMPGSFDRWRSFLQDIVTAACIDALGVAPVDFVKKGN